MDGMKTMYDALGLVCPQTGPPAHMPRKTVACRQEGPIGSQRRDDSLGGGDHAEDSKTEGAGRRGEGWS